MNGDELSRLSHAEKPWVDARGDLAEGTRSSTVIAVAMMAAYYARQVASETDAVAHAVSSAALEGVTVPEDHLEVLFAVASGAQDADSLDARPCVVANPGHERMPGEPFTRDTWSP